MVNFKYFGPKILVLLKGSELFDEVKPTEVPVNKGARLEIDQNLSIDLKIKTRWRIKKNIFSNYGLSIILKNESKTQKK